MSLLWNQIFRSTSTGLGLAIVMAVPASLRAQAPAPLQSTMVPTPAGVEVDTFANNLDVPWKIQFAPDGRLFIAQRLGMIRIIPKEGQVGGGGGRGGGGAGGGSFGPNSDGSFATVQDQAYLSGESGLMGLALHPQFTTEPWVYVMYSVQGVEGGPYDRVSRYRETAAGGGPEEIIVDSLPMTGAYGNNRGGSIAFGPDGMLYIAIGDYYQPNLAGDPSSRIGKILRVTPSGDVPPDNPVPNSPVWASGFRNPRGLTWHPQTRQLFVADNGNARGDPVQFPDRILAVQKGAFHGWGTAPAGATTVQPIVTFDRPAPPGDLMFYKGALYMTVLGFNSIGAQSLIKVGLDNPANPTRATSVERWFVDETGKSTFGRLRAMTIGPDGALYVGSSSHDGRTMDRRNGDDQVVKLIIP